MRYQITAHASSKFEEFVVKAESYEEAAQKAVARITKSKTVCAERTTGEGGKSGVFQGYRFVRRLNASTRVGCNFHVTTAD